MTSTQTARQIIGNGLPIQVEPKRNGHGLKLTQGDSYLLVSPDELESLVAAMRELIGTPATTPAKALSRTQRFPIYRHDT